LVQLNASDERGIDVVREQIKEFAGTKKLFSTGLKLVILDEADAMTSEAQFALRRGNNPNGSFRRCSACDKRLITSPSLSVCAVIEKYTSNTRFCMICNYVNKIIPALQSRCTKFRFGPLETEQIRGRLQHVIEQEGCVQLHMGLLTTEPSD
jgi:replication factor C subunit 3/5